MRPRLGAQKPEPELPPPRGHQGVRAALEACTPTLGASEPLTLLAFNTGIPGSSWKFPPFQGGAGAGGEATLFPSKVRTDPGRPSWPGWTQRPGGWEEARTHTCGCRGPSQLLQLMGEETGLRVNKRRRQKHHLHTAARLWCPQRPPLGTGQLAALMPYSLFLAPRSKNTL